MVRQASEPTISCRFVPELRRLVPAYTSIRKPQSADINMASELPFPVPWSSCPLVFLSPIFPMTHSVTSRLITPKMKWTTYYEIIWNDQPGGNVEHIAEHGLTPEEIEEVIFNPLDRDVSRSFGLPIVFGFTPEGRYILVVYEQIDEVTVFPVTAYDVEE